MNKLTTVTLAILMGGLPFVASAGELSEARIKELVYEAIRENPDIIMEAVAILQQREDEAQASATQSILSDQRAALERDPNAPVLGNPDGDVTVVEFFDYNCPYCKRAMTEVQALLEADADVRLVYREWPVLGEGSVFASPSTGGPGAGEIRRVPPGADGFPGPGRRSIRSSHRKRSGP